MLSVDKTHLAAGPAFENQCGRFGCAHIFKYAGTNPFEDLATLVAKHAPYCAGRIPSATHPCHTEWEPSTEVLDHFYQPVDDPAMFQNFGQCWGADWSADFTKSDAGHSDGYDGYDNDDDVEYGLVEDIEYTLVETIGTQVKRKKKGAAKPKRYEREEDIEYTLVESIGASVKRKRKPAAQRKPRTKPTVKAVVLGPDGLPRKKKGARTEAQRRAVLTNDPWTGTVAAHYVSCLGCKSTIMLDARSRYYPGLWEKHRMRCPGVNKNKDCAEANVSPAMGGSVRAGSTSVV